MIAAIIGLAICCVVGLVFSFWKATASKGSRPVSVNYFFTRECNASCGFCFHTAKTSHILSMDDACRGLRLLKDAGMRKINFAGGEPFLYPKLLGKMSQFCKDELKLESVSIITNGSKVTESFFRQYGKYIDILAVSCDSFNQQTNVKIGRTDNGKDFDNITNLSRIADLCRAYGVMFKMNTVVCRLNWQESMFEEVARLQPFRWKVFQVLIIAGENDSEQTKRNATDLTITNAQFQDFCSRHKHLSCFVPEDNNAMKSSYILVDEYMRFLDKDRNLQSASLLQVGVDKALAQIFWDEEAFVNRGGIYDWTRDRAQADGGCSSEIAVKGKDLEW